MKDDGSIVEEVRRRRMEISARFDHDLDKYFAHLRAIERSCGNRVVSQVTVIRPARAPADEFDAVASTSNKLDGGPISR